MASIIKLKRSATQGSIPNSLELGEIAVNLFDRRLYVGNSSGVTAVGGEAFKITTQDAGGDGAYIKLLGETVPSTNSILIQGGTDLDVTRQANGTITVALEQTISSNTTGNAGTATALETARTIAGQSFDGTANITIAATDLSDTDQSLATTDDVTFNTVTADLTGDVTGNADTASALATARNIQISGDVAGTASFDGSQNINIAVTQQNNSVDLGTHTTGNYVATIAGTANEISVTGSGSETAAVQIGLPDDVSITAQLNVGENLVVSGNTSVGGDFRVTGDTVLDGNLTVEGALTYISTSTVYTDDGMFKLGANNAGDTIDTGIYAKYTVSGNSAVQYSGYFRDATDGVFKFYTGLDVEPTATVDTTDTGYGLAQVDAIIDGGSY